MGGNWMNRYLVVFCVLVTQMFFASCTKTEYENFGGIHGMVIDSGSGVPISKASVILSPGGATQWTDSEGNYKFENLDAEPQYTISVQHVNYKTDKRTITIRIGESMLMNFSLVSDTGEL